MKCLNMKIADVLLFLANFITIYSSEFPQNKTSQMAPPVNEVELFKTKLSRDCPQLSEIVRENNLEDYAINCRSVASNSITVEYVLQHICFVVRDMLELICDKKFNVTNSLKQNNSEFCPFNFTHSEQLGVKFSNYGFVKELTEREHCSKVCYDLYNRRPECNALSMFNNFLYLQSINPPTTKKDLVPSEVDKAQVKPDQTETTIQKTESSLVSTKSEQQLQKDEVTENKAEMTNPKLTMARVNSTTAMKTENKIEKSEAISSTPKKEQTSESELRIQENDNLMPENTEDDFNEDDLEAGGYQPAGLKPDVLAPVPNIPKTETEIEDVLPSLKQKDAYSADRFFQAEDSHFFFYFIMVSSVIVIGYLAFHNKNKILAYALEGTNSRRSRRRPNPARYRKLETNLEEVISSNSTNMAASSVVY